MTPRSRIWTLLLLALAALLASGAEASRTSVWEQNPPAAVLAKTDAASLLTTLAPAGPLESTAANAELTEPPRFELGDVVLADTADTAEERFGLGPLDLLGPTPQRGPPPGYPETRVRGLELSGPFRVGASPALSLWPRQACGFSCADFVSDGRQDPWGLEEEPGPVNKLLDWVGSTWVGRRVRSLFGYVDEAAENAGALAAQRAQQSLGQPRPLDPDRAPLIETAGYDPESFRGAASGLQPGRDLKVAGRRDVGDVTHVLVAGAARQAAYWQGARVLEQATQTLAEAGRVLDGAKAVGPREVVRLPKPGRVTFDGMEVRSVRDLSHLKEGRLRAMAEKGFAATDAKGNPLEVHHPSVLF